MKSAVREGGPRRRGRPRTVPLAVRRTAVLKAAVREFGAHGMYGAAVDRISTAAGVAKPGLYELFASKERLFEAAVEHECEHLVRHLSDAYDAARALRPAERVLARVQAVFDYADARPDGFRFLLLTTNLRTPGVARTVDAARRRVTGVLAGVLREEMAGAGVSVPAVPADMLAEMIVGACVHSIRRASDEPRWDDRGLAGLLAAFISGGLRSLPQEAIAQAARRRRAAV